MGQKRVREIRVADYQAIYLLNLEFNPKKRRLKSSQRKQTTSSLCVSKTTK